ncbi:MAG TPA: hypothetical protein VE196_11955 [Pseudonocardiaceae bacterium]|jgi:hypothetical protein|nr:hypothetical protein [Pseudonocardiaceae bacterium]
MGEVEALTVLCAYLGDLDRRAGAEMWADRLDRVVRRVREGSSAAQACARLGLTTADDSGDVRGPGVGKPRIAGLRVPELPLGKGNFTCPRRMCQRRGQRDDNGHPPHCALYEQPMQPQ